MRDDTNQAVQPAPAAAASTERLAVQYVRDGTAINPKYAGFVLRRADTIEGKRIKWLWPDRIPLGKITLFVGNPDEGKSLVACSVVARATTGTDWFDLPNTAEPAEVLMLIGEDDIEDTVKPRLEAAGADLGKIHFLRAELDLDRDIGDIRFDKDMPMIRGTLAAHPNIRLIVVDPLSNYLGDADMNVEQKIRRQVLIPLRKLAAETGVTVLGVMHLNKKVDLNAINRIGGAMGFVGVARAAWLFVKNPERAVVPSGRVIRSMLRVKANLTAAQGGLMFVIETRPLTIEGEEAPIPFVRFTGRTDQSADELLAPTRPVGRPRDEREGAKTWLADFLKNGPQPAEEVFDRGDGLHGFSRRTLVRAKAELGVRSYKRGDAWYWEAPTGRLEDFPEVNADDYPEIFDREEA